MDEREIFKGSENPMTMKQTYTHEFHCRFNLENYPFDKQTCSIDMKSRDLDALTMKLIPGFILMQQGPELTLFHIEFYSLDFMPDRNAKEKGIQMTVILRRKILSEMMSTYLPSILLIIITFATTFFKQFYFEAAICVNLTNMLVMTTIFTSKIEELPPTSDTKMIDIWLIFCLLVPFAFTLIQTAIESYREETTDAGVSEAWSPAPVEEGLVVRVFTIPT